MFAEEAQAGNAFEVNISLRTKAPKNVVTSLEETINYAEVYRVTKELFSNRKDLLETLAMELADLLKQHFPLISKATIQIIKLNPPIASFTGSVAVTFTKKYKD